MFYVVSCKTLNLGAKKLERIRKEDREVVKKLNYQGVDFPVSKKDYGKIEILNKSRVNMFCYENKVVYPVYLSDKDFSDSIDLLLISNDFFTHYVYIKDFNRLMFNKTRHNGKKYFCKSCLQCFSSENVLNEHKKDCLLINRGQNVKLEKGFISFKDYPKQMRVPFKIYADECCSYIEKYQDHVHCSFTYKVVCIDDEFSKNVVLYRGENAVLKFIKSIFKEYGYCRKVMKKHFNKNLVMSAEENQKFEMTNIC